MLCCFEWKNLPDTCSDRILEQSLYNQGSAVFFKDDIVGFLALPVNLVGNFDVNGESINRAAYSNYNNYKNNLTNKNSVVIYNNYHRMGSESIVSHYALRLYNLERSIDINLSLQKFPTIIKCSESQRLTMENLFNDYEGNQPFIFGDTALDTTGIEVLDLKAPYLVDKFEMQKHMIMSNFLNAIGIENSNADKKERLVSDEVGANDGIVEMSRYIYLNERRIAADKINKMFDLNIEVGYRSNLDTEVNFGFIDPEILEQKRGVDNE